MVTLMPLTLSRFLFKFRNGYMVFKDEGMESNSI